MFKKISLKGRYRYIFLILIGVVGTTVGILHQRYVERTDNGRVPWDLAILIPDDMTILEFHQSDLNRDGYLDYLYVLENPASEEKVRTLGIALHQDDGTFKVVKTNSKVVYCGTCGGMMGDPFTGVDVDGSSFTVHHYGGSAWRWDIDFSFTYSRIDKTWQLVRVYSDSFHAPDTEHVKSKVEIPPRDFGKIDLADFDPDNYRYQYKKR